ncbi:MAG: hypothetical protein P8Y42_22020 [Exilibacterium sp.]
MESFRVVYRNIIIESILFVCVIFQVSSGVHFVWKRLNHIGAVLFGRVSAGLDTNIYYGIAGFHISPFQLYFLPYYFLAVVAIFVHLASAFNWLTRNKITEILRVRIAYSVIIIGITVSVTLMLGFSGVFSEIKIPPEYSAIYE